MKRARIQTFGPVDRGSRPELGALSVVDQEPAVLYHHEEVHLEARVPAYVSDPSVGGHLARDGLTGTVLAAAPQINRARFVTAWILMSSVMRAASRGVMGQSKTLQGVVLCPNQKWFATSTTSAVETGSRDGLVV